VKSPAMGTGARARLPNLRANYPSIVWSTRLADADVNNSQLFRSVYTHHISHKTINHQAAALKFVVSAP